MTNEQKNQAYSEHRKRYREEAKRQGLLPPDRVAKPSDS